MSTWQLPIVAFLSTFNVFLLGRRMYNNRGLIFSDESMVRFAESIARDMLTGFWESRRGRASWVC